uniref:Uncharacterized protein n=1 Tax=Gasterosteus aculeatus aculeatus TaxID=481459 RepID=A0AAQ4S343_GASAC
DQSTTDQLWIRCLSGKRSANCLRGRDSGLISQLQELDRQISDLRLDSEVSHQLETDSRPSSGFYDLSDEASVSLSNSSNSVFSECFCSFTEADGGVLSADQPASRPSPHPGFRAAPLISQSSSWPASSSSHAQSYKRLDGYIYGLLQRRGLPVRTSRPRTSISADSSKTILRHAGFCTRQVSGSGLVTLRGSEFRGGASAGAASSPQRSVDSKCEVQVVPDGSVDFKMSNSDSDNNQKIQKGSNKDSDPKRGLLRQTSAPPPSPSLVSTASLPQEFREPDIPKTSSSPIDTKLPCCLADSALLLKISPKPPQALRAKKVDVAGQGSFSMSLDKGCCTVIAETIAAHQQTIKSCRCWKKVKVKTAMTLRTGRGLEPNERNERRGDQTHRRSVSKKSWLPDERGSRIRHIASSMPEARVLGKHATPGDIQALSPWKPPSPPKTRPGGGCP